MNFWDFFSLFKIQHPAWLPLDHKKLKPSDMRLWDPCIMKLKNALWCVVYCFENHILGYLLNFRRIQIALNVYILLTKAFKTLVPVEINKVLRESGVEDRHLVAGFENNRAGGSRFEKVGSENFFRNHPNAPLGPKSPKNPTHLLLSENMIKEGERAPF